MERKVFKAILIAALAVCVSACGTSTNQSQSDDGGEDSLRPIPEGFVDLGLSVKWAACNLGATKPEEFGDYYAWGETETKEEYSVRTSKWHGINTATLKSKGVINGKGILTADYDVATKLLGEGCRMPTLEEQTELFEKCTWKKTQLNEVNGYEFVGPNGNSIFLPTAGFKTNTFHLLKDTLGWYSSSVIADDGTVRMNLDAFSFGWWYIGENNNSTDMFRCKRVITYRDIGVSVRPVWK